MNELDEREGLWVREYVDWESAPADSDLRAVSEGAASVSLVQVYDAPQLEPRFDLTEHCQNFWRVRLFHENRLALLQREAVGTGVKIRFR